MIQKSEREGSTGKEHPEIPPAVIEWLENRIQKVEYGEIGIVFIMHNGRIKRIRKIDNEQIQPE